MSRPPDHSRDASKDNLDFEIRFFEDLLKDSPDYLDALIPLAEAYTRKGWHQKGLNADLRIAALRPRDPVAHYNLACSYALLRRNTDALPALEKALALGYTDLKHLEKDADLAGLRRDPRLRELLLRFFKPSGRGA